MDASIELPRLAARLKAAGAVGIQREMVSRLRATTKEQIPYFRGAAGSELPQAGGLANYVSRKKFSTSVRTGPRTAGVTLKLAGKGNYTNEGKWRHPVFGNRKNWVEQTYAPAAHWWDRVVVERTPEAAVSMEAILAAIGIQVNGLGI